MQDRVPLYPGRVKLVPVAGLTNTYTMTRDDHPTQEGTPLNKSTFLKDETAALYDLGENAVPDDIFAKLKPLIDSIQNTANEKAQIETGSYTGNGGTNVTLTFSKTPSIVFVQEGPDYDRLYIAIMINPVPTAVTIGSPPNRVYGELDSITWSGTKVSWSGEGGDAISHKWLNYTGTQYYYVAIIE